MMDSLNPDDRPRRSFEELEEINFGQSLYYFQGRPFTGVAYSESNGKLLREVEMRLGVPWGIERIQDQLGRPRKLQYWVGGIWMWVCLEWW